MHQRPDEYYYLVGTACELSANHDHPHVRRESYGRSYAKAVELAPHIAHHGCFRPAHIYYTKFRVLYSRDPEISLVILTSRHRRRNRSSPPSKQPFHWAVVTSLTLAASEQKKAPFLPLAPCSLSVFGAHSRYSEDKTANSDQRRNLPAHNRDGYSFLALVKTHQTHAEKGSRSGMADRSGSQVLVAPHIFCCVTRRDKARAARARGERRRTWQLDHRNGSQRPSPGPGLFGTVPYTALSSA